MCRCHLTALKPTRRELQVSAEGFTEGDTAAQFTERWCSATFRAIPSTLERIDTAPHISLHLPVAATTYNLSVSRHLTTTVSVRSASAAASRRLKRPRRSSRPPGGNGWRGRSCRRCRSPGSLTDLGLIDEYRLYFRPVVLGRGKPFFAGPRPPLRLVASDLIGEDAIRLTYVPASSRNSPDRNC
jgi:hypothetical protein